MFWYRLKNEFVENRRLLGLLWLAMAVVTWSFYRWWFGDFSGDFTSEAVSGFSLFGTGLAALGLITTSFKRDDLKSPEAFWATRPIRSLPFFGAKLVFIQLVFTLPCGILMASFGLITGIGWAALQQGLELSLWLLFATTLLSVSCMAFAGSGRSFLCPIVFFGSIMLPCVLLGNHLVDGLKKFVVDHDQRIGNLAVALVAFTALVLFLAIRQMRDKHAPTRMGWFAAAGFFSFLLVTFAPIPGVVRDLRGETTVTPVATSLTLENERFGTQVMTGTKNGARMFTVQGKLTLPEIPSTDDSTTTSIESVTLEVHNTGGAACGADWANMLHQEMSKDGSGSRISAIQLNIATYDRQPEPHGSNSMRYDPAKELLIRELPKRKVRVTGTVTLMRRQYRPIGRAHLDEPITQYGPGFALAYAPGVSQPKHPIDASNPIMSYRGFAPSLLSGAGQYQGWAFFRTRLVHPVYNAFNLDELGGSSSYGNSLFGWNSRKECRLPTSVSSYEQQRMRDAGYHKSLTEWQREVMVVFEKLDHTSRITIPVDAEYEIPDPVKVREMMLKGEL